MLTGPDGESGRGTVDSVSDLLDFAPGVRQQGGQHGDAGEMGELRRDRQHAAGAIHDERDEKNWCKAREREQGFDEHLDRSRRGGRCTAAGGS